MFRGSLPGLFLVVSVACGGAPSADDGAMRVGVSFRALECTRDGVQAKLQVTGGYECPLVLRADGTAHGVCSAIPTGGIRDFRLVYFIVLEANRPETLLELATAVITRDLTHYSDSELRLVFTPADLETDLDDDGDGQSNVTEFCLGTNPRGM